MNSIKPYEIEYIDLVHVDPDQQNNQSNALSFGYIFGLVALSYKIIEH